MGLVVRGNYVWCHVIFVIFMGFGGAKRRENPLKSSSGVAMQATTERGLFREEDGDYYYVILLC